MIFKNFSSFDKNYNEMSWDFSGTADDEICDMMVLAVQVGIFTVFTS